MQRRKIFRIFDRYFGIPLVLFLALFTKRKRRLPIESIRNILIIKLAAIGDAILLVPALRKLKNSFPRAKITFMCSDVNISFVEKITYVDKIINCHVYDFIKNPLYFFKFIKELRKTKYELVIDAGQWERINSFITIFTRRNYSVGFKTKGQLKHIINDFVVEHIPQRHEVENFMDLLMPLGIIPLTGAYPYDDIQLEFFLKPEHRAFRDKFWKQHGLADKTVICFHPGCGENGKPREWDIDNYVILGKMLSAFDNNIRILLTGTKHECYLCDRINSELPGITINTAGEHSLEETAALIERSKLMVCSNTGILHVSASVGTLTIGMHGPTNPAKWGAFNKKAIVIQSDKFCSPCLYLGHDYGCKHPTCMLHITVNEVFMALRKALQPEFVKSVT